MRTSIILLISILFIPTLHAQMQVHKYFPLGPPLSYVESSASLKYPNLDGGPIGFEFGDVNSDGFVDIVTVGDHGSPYVNTPQHGICIWFGDGTGRGWVNQMTGDFGYGGVALGDVNHDGLMDVGYGIHHNYSGIDLGNGLLEVALGDGTGRNWTAWDDGLEAHGPGWGMFDCDFADLDVDGDLDIVSISFGSGDGLCAYLNNGDGTWTLSFVNMGGNSSCEVLCGDINGDGYPDIAAGHQSGTVFVNDGAGHFTNADGNLPDAGSYGTHRGPDLRDINGDGCEDISFCTGLGDVEVWLYDIPGRWSPFKQGLPTASDFDKTQLADMDGDGRVDLVAFGMGTVKVWQYDNQGLWTDTVTFHCGTPGYAETLRVVDVDFNGRPDILLVSDEGSWPSYRNHLHFYLEKSRAHTVNFKLTYPTGGESIYRNAVVFIDWVSAVPKGGGGASKVTIEISTNGPAGPWSDIAVDVLNNGRYQWLVPASLSPSSDCRLRVTLASPAGNDVYIMDKPFSLL